MFYSFILFFVRILFVIIKTFMYAKNYKGIAKKIQVVDGVIGMILATLILGPKSIYSTIYIQSLRI